MGVGPGESPPRTHPLYSPFPLLSLFPFHLCFSLSFSSTRPPIVFVLSTPHPNLFHFVLQRERTLYGTVRSTWKDREEEKMILSWVQTKINGRQEKKTFEAASARNYAKREHHKEEFSDWPHGLLAIGTFGNNEVKKEQHMHEVQQNPHPVQDLSEFTLDEMNKLEKQLAKLLSLRPKYKAFESEAGKGCNSKPLDKFLNYPSSLEVDRLTCRALCDKVENGESGDLSPNTMIILNKAKDFLVDNRNAIRQKSVSFLLKKMFACRSGFAPVPSLRDPISESRIEKLLKAILHKKIYPQNSAPMTVKKYLELRRTSETEMRDKILMMMSEKTGEKSDDGCKWVKTDSERYLYITKVISDDDPTLPEKKETHE
ncbi:hypothetical protein Taro_051862 [Colocasia esculenta]|uniref:Uncharacterized protein n=1 Tax=Colocasia esculenta TaxID=4460 RepID=A0A843XH21_COLES|nr:hypothetical protein [Colocasia esculenta]